MNKIVELALINANKTHISIKNFKVNGSPQKINKNNHTAFDIDGKCTTSPVIKSMLRVLVLE